MKKLTVIILTALLMTACATSTYYRTSTGFYYLHRGMTKSQFIAWSKPGWTDKHGKPVVGGKPDNTKMFKHGNDIWEVWVFKVYSPGELSGHMFFDHYEHIAFKNDKVEEWGTGQLPLTIRQNPNQFQYDINVHNR